MLSSSSQPEDLEQRLKAHGWKLDEQVPGMAISLEQCDAIGKPYPVGFSIHEVTDGTTMQTWLKVFTEGFGFPPLIRDIFLGLYEKHGYVSGNGVRYFLGSLNDEPVGTTLLTFGGGLAGIYGVATLPQARRQGVGEAMTLATMRVAHAAGYRVGTLQATPMGLPVYRRLGWQEYCSFKTYTYQPENNEGHS
jgi:GNAT superfamily N-acetyltransferase